MRRATERVPQSAISWRHELSSETSNTRRVRGNLRICGLRVFILLANSTYASVPHFRSRHLDFTHGSYHACA